MHRCGVLTRNSYNKVNGTYACENGGILNKLLKDELGFRGYVLSDWNGMTKHCNIIVVVISSNDTQLSTLQLAALTEAWI